jgi:hypothetical protein
VHARARAWSFPRPEASHKNRDVGQGMIFGNEGTHFLYAHCGATVLEWAGMQFPLHEGMYARVPGECKVHANPSGAGSEGLVVTHLVADDAHVSRGMFQLGGPIEAQGRLRYIDGCTDSLIIAPSVLGDPCFNHLHIPKHPSVRVGIVVRGKGLCLMQDSQCTLEPGLAFMLAADLAHSFVTEADSLDVVVYHPETDSGPTHEDHPMLNRTIIGAP